MSPQSADRNLLFGIVALQMDFITRDQLTAAMNAWILDKPKSLGQILSEQGVLSPEDREAIESLVRRHLLRHGDDAERSLCALPNADAVHRSLEPIADGDLQRSLHALPRGEAPPPSGHAPPSEGSTAAWDGDLLTLTNRYRVLRDHARGGIGDVALAKDEVFDRRIAVKRIQERWQVSDQYAQFRARFLVEAEVTGGLDHPFIVPIHGLGFDRSNRPFYAMRFIEGTSFKTAAAEFHQSLTHPHLHHQWLVTFQDLLNRLIQVCHAVHYAHERGVIHRDIKPGNIMLGKHGETLLVDWGFAKVVDRPEPARADGEPSLHPSSASDVQPTEAGALVGTIAYMSPEQAEGFLDAIDRRADVYAIGATLYYLLTGRPQVEAGDVVDQIRRIKTGAIPRPRQAAKAPDARVKLDIPKPLEAICAKAMALKPDDRYATAAELAEDLKKFLAREPVMAYRENRVERAQRWTRRHKTLVTSAAAVLVMATIAAGLFAFQRNAHATAMGAKNLELSKANTDLDLQRKKAEAREQIAIDAVKRFRDAVVEDEVLRGNPSLESLRKKLLKEPLAFFKTLREQLQADRDTRPESLARLASASFELGSLTNEIGDKQDALRAYQESLAIYDRLAREHPSVIEFQRSLAESQNNLGILLAATGQPAKARAALEQAISIREQLIRDHPSDNAFQSGLASSRGNLANLLSDTGQPADAKSALEQAISIQERLVRSNPKVTEYQRDLGGSYNNLGLLLHSLGDPTKALAVFRKGIEIQERLVGEYPNVAEFQTGLASIHNSNAILLSAIGNPTDALAAFRRALAIRERLAREYPTITKFQSDLARSHGNIGSLLQIIGKPSEALVPFQNALEVFDRLAREDPADIRFHRDVAQCHFNVGVVLEHTGKLPEAMAAYRDALATYKQLVLKNPSIPEFKSGLAQSYHNLGGLLRLMGKKTDALTAFQESLTIREQLVRENPGITAYKSDLANSHYRIGRLFLDTGKTVLALAEFRHAVAIGDRVARQNPTITEFQSSLAAAHEMVGDVLFVTGKADEAVSAYDEAIRLRTLLAKQNPTLIHFQSELAITHSLRGRALYVSGETSAAEAAHRQALELYKDVVEASPSIPEYRNQEASGYTNLSGHLRLLGRPAESVHGFDRAIKIRETLVRENPGIPGYRGHLAYSLRARGLARRDLGDLPGAAADSRRALELWDSLPTRSSEDWFETACAHATLSALAGLDGSGIPAANGPTEADAAIALLRKSITMGFHTLSTLRHETALDSLRERHDFIALMCDIAFPDEPFAQ